MRRGGIARDGLQRGAEVRDHTDLESQHRAVPFERQLGGHDLVATLIRGEEILAPRGNPLDGPAELQRQVAGQRFLLVERGLAAEAPADIGRDHADTMLRKADGGGEISAHAVRTLGREPHREIPRWLWLRQDAARLKRQRHQPRAGDAQAHNMLGLGERLVHVAALFRRRVADVAVQLFAGQRRARLERLFRH